MAKSTKSCINEIFFSGYKNLFECDLSLDHLSIIVGPNNSGKSNFLDVFKILSSLHFGGQDDRDRILHSSLNGKQVDIRLAGTVLSDETQAYEVVYKLSYETSSEPEKPKLQIVSESFDLKQPSKPGIAKQLFHRSGSQLALRSALKSFKKFEISSEIPAYTFIRASFEPERNAPEIESHLDIYFRFLEYFKTTVFSAHKLNAAYDKEIERAVEELAPLQEEKSEDFEKFSAAFTDILGFTKLQLFDVGKEIQGLSLKNKIIYCFVFEDAKKPPVFISQLSDGSKILFLMLYNIFIKKSPLICIEEPEIGLHPNALNKILTILSRGEVGSQVLLTTHSAYLLNLVNPKNVYLMEGDGFGRSTLTPTRNIKDLEARLKGRYVNFGDLFADNFRSQLKSKIVE